MIYIDAREGLSGDMLLAGMIGLLDSPERSDALSRMSRAAEAASTEFRFVDVEEFGEAGHGISYSGKGTEEVSRSYGEAMDLMKRMDASSPSRDASGCGANILDTLFRAESAVHGLPVSEVHLHEIGRASAILNMYGIGQVYSMLRNAGAGEFVCSTITTGSGITVIAHGAVRVPAPASKHLLEGLKHQKGSGQGERATPTGLAAVRVISGSQSDDLPSSFRKRSVGFGTRRFGGRLGRTVLIWP